MDDLLSEFLTETNESLESLDTELVRLEQNPNDPELLGNIFRLVHTIKGTCGFLGLPRLESVAHAGENVLGNFREGIQVVTPDAVSLILEALDRIKDLMGALEATEQEPEGDDSDLIARLDALYRSAKEGGSASAAVNGAATEAVASPSAEKPASSQSVYERLGGASTIDTAVELFYRKVEKDAALAPLFDGVEMVRLHGRQVEFMVMELGGPNEFEPEDLRNIHAQMMERGLDEQHFVTFAAMLSDSLSELGVEQPLIDETLRELEPFRYGFVVDGAEAPVNGETEPLAEINGATPLEPPKPEVVETPQQETAAAQPKENVSKESAVANQSLRVNVDLLEDLMTMVSELVLTRNQLMQMVRKYDDSEFKVPLQRLSHVTTDLQEGVMKTRMQPIGNAWAKLPRIVRDLAHELDKKVDLEMLGADTELDRQVLDMIKDPLTHMVRNSGDHGLETPAERKAAGKSETGKIVLNAFHEGGHIIIEISDDGHGINSDKVKAKAIANGLVSEAEIETLTEQQILQFIFKPGFSTAEKVTSVSGRGVGMDVVRTNMEKIGGTIELQSKMGEGSKFTIKIPLTLAIVSALIVECGGEKFAIPQLSVVELVRASRHSEHRIERIKDTPVLRLRNKLLPLISLADLLKLNKPEIPVITEEGEAVSEMPAPAAVSGHEDGSEDPQAFSGREREIFVVVAQVGNYNFGIVVDKVFDTEEIVVKPVAPILRDIPVYSGNTILGDGSVIMILDLNGIASASGDISVAEQNAAGGEAEKDAGQGEKVPILIFNAAGEDPKAVPLSLVARLEEIEREEIEYSDGTPVVQYRGQLMPLHSFHEEGENERTGRQPIVVFADGGHSMGLIVDDIIDIVEEHLEIEIVSETNGILGSAVIAGKATDVIDTSYFLTRAFGDWFTSDTEGGSDGSAGRVLLVDDSAFFRNLISPLLSVAGYQVTAVESADRALALRESGANFDVIVSDIEMPGMDGFEFAENIRRNGSWQDMPVVALSSHATSSHIQRGREVGFTDYVAKLDRTALLESLSQTISSTRSAA